MALHSWGNFKIGIEIRNLIGSGNVSPRVTRGIPKGFMSRIATSVIFNVLVGNSFTC